MADNRQKFLSQSVGEETVRALGKRKTSQAMMAYLRGTPVSKAANARPIGHLPSAGKDESIGQPGVAGNGPSVALQGHFAPRRDGGGSLEAMLREREIAGRRGVPPGG